MDEGTREAYSLRLLLILVSPHGTPGFQTAVNLAEAALRRGHEAIIFGTGDGVENLTEGADDTLVRRLTTIREAGMRLMVCRESTRRRGLSPEGGLIKKVEMSSLAEMVELMDFCDKTLVFG
jgi:sulfur relay (sulfurtransferase) complex TusBCD TusD component (DsrE family)